MGEISESSPRSVHLRPPRQHHTLCGLQQRNVRTTRRLSLTTCQGCLDALRQALQRAEELKLQRKLEELQRLGQLPEAWSLPPVTIAEPAEDSTAGGVCSQPKERGNLIAVDGGIIRR
jgi:hypothetical protein